MSNQEVNSSTGVTPQNSVITSTTEEDNQSNEKSPSSEPVSSRSEDYSHDDLGDSSSACKPDSYENDALVVRSESVIKSPFQIKPLFVSSSTTPVIKVVDSSRDHIESECNSELKRPFGSHFSTFRGTSQNSNIFSTSTIPPTNPFSRTSSFSSNFISSSTISDTNDSNSESSIVFEPSKLIPSSTSSIFDSNILRPSVLRTKDSCSEENKTETISTIKTFISLNKEDIGKIKTPSFIKNSLNALNGKSSTSQESDIQKESSEIDNISPDTEYLFGQNLEDRVVLDSSTSVNSDTKNEINSTSDNLISFSDVTNCESKLDNNSNDNIKSDESPSNYEPCISSSSSSRQKDNTESLFKRKYEVITGEEDEQNVLSIFGKLYAWDTQKSSWIEKGRGHLRLNDVIKNDKLCSRLVMRTTGVLRVILNAHIVAGMKFDFANDNCLRFTYVDGIYLIKGNPKDIDQLNSAIEYRLREIVKRAKTSEKSDDTENESSTESV